MKEKGRRREKESNEGNGVLEKRCGAGGGSSPETRWPSGGGGGCRGRSTALRVSVSPFPDMANHVAGPIDAPGGASGFS